MTKHLLNLVPQQFLRYLQTSRARHAVMPDELDLLHILCRWTETLLTHKAIL